MQHVFIVGSKGIPGAYGGYETFVDKLTEYHQNHPELFEDFSFTGLNNFDLLSSDFIARHNDKDK